jgi:hypothetical protein
MREWLNHSRIGLTIAGGRAELDHLLLLPAAAAAP